ncbi:hypothetical protein ES705_14373 [subsurface metagenome]
MNYCLATITDKYYYKGTIALLNTFFIHNEWFNGKIIIIHNELSQQSIDSITEKYNALFHQVDNGLMTKLYKIKEQIPQLESLYKRFFILEIFKFSHFDRVVYIDSDILCKRDISPLFFREEDFIACKDVIKPNYYRNVNDFSIKKYESSYQNNLRTFNSGVLSISNKFLSEEIYKELVSYLIPRTWQGIKDHYGDEIILNRYFIKQTQLISNEYNYRIHLEKHYVQNENLFFKDARLIHYTGINKPWRIKNQVRLLLRNFKYWKYIWLWYKCCL